jgi:hypothetical protein
MGGFYPKKRGLIDPWVFLLPAQLLESWGNMLQEPVVGILDAGAQLNFRFPA